MKAFQFDIKGDWAHFKKRETGNNPLTHDLIPKTALIGMIGAVLGIERTDMKPLFPQFSNDFLYGVSFLNPLKKLSWGFTSARGFSKQSPIKPHSPKYFEFLKSPCFRILLALNEKGSEQYFDTFRKYIEKEITEYPPILGWHNCPAELSFHSSGDLKKIENGEFETQSFVSNHHQLKGLHEIGFRVGFDRIPTFQNEDFYNLPEKYQSIVYSDNENSLKFKGEYYKYDSGIKEIENWWLT